MESDDKIDSQGEQRPLSVDDARVVVDFGAGPPGVGPVIGVDADDFFPSAPNADVDRNRAD